jgi:hypothetical protein
MCKPFGSTPTLYPTKNTAACESGSAGIQKIPGHGYTKNTRYTKNTGASHIEEDDDKTVITSNISGSHELCGIITQPRKPSIPPMHAVADTGATPVFILKGGK